MALGGGIFSQQDKFLPGSYINFVSASNAVMSLGERGAFAMGLELDWGSTDEVFRVTAQEFKSVAVKLFGYDAAHPSLAPVREAFRHGRTGYFYRLNGGDSAVGAPTPLPAPNGLFLSGSTLTWNPVALASMYRVYSNGGWIAQTETASFNLVSALSVAGTYAITIVAVGNGITHSDSPASASINYVVSSSSTQLPAPTGLAINGSTLTWNAVTNATGYIIRDNGSQIGVSTGASYSLAGVTSAGTHPLSVVATGDSVNYFMSQPSAAVNYVVSGTPLAAPTGLNINGSILTWNAVTNASGYKIRAAGNQIGTSSTPTFDLSILTAAQTYTVTVIAAGDGNTYTDSPASAGVSYVVSGSSGGETITNGLGQNITVVDDPTDLIFVEAIVATGASLGTISSYPGNASAAGRAAANNMVLAVNGGETITMSESAPSGQVFTFAEFSDAPISQSTLSAGGVGGGAWLTTGTLKSDTKYVLFGFRNGDGSTRFTQDQLNMLGTYIII